MRTQLFTAETNIKVGSKGLAVMILQIILLGMGFNQKNESRR